MRAPLTIGALLGALSLLGCDDTLFFSEGGEVPDGTDFCAVKTIIGDDCLGCHSAVARLGDYDLETDPYAALVAIGYYGVAPVLPGDPEGSLFYQKVTDTQPSDGSLGGVMPQGTAGLSEEAAGIIYDWIAAGAEEECGGGTTDGGGTDSGGTDGGGTDGGGTDSGGTDGGGTDSGGTDSGTTVPDDGSQEYCEVLEIIEENCVSCHFALHREGHEYDDAVNDGGGLDLQTSPHYSLLGKIGYYGDIPVVAGSTEDSILHRKITEDDLPDVPSSDPAYIGGPMPRGLNDGSVTGGGDEVGVLYDWIQSGAAEGSDFDKVAADINGACMGCHNAEDAVFGLDLETDLYTTLFETGTWGVPLVVAGDPEGSLLYKKATNTQAEDGSEGAAMPPPLPQSNKDTIEAWIEAGASEACGGEDDFCEVFSIFEYNCLGCHNADDDRGAFELEIDQRYNLLTRVGAYGVAPVIAGDPEGSLLYVKVTGDVPKDGSLGGAMPAGTAGLSAEDAQVIYDWIDKGAGGGAIGQCATSE